LNKHFQVYLTYDFLKNLSVFDEVMTTTWCFCCNTV